MATELSIGSDDAQRLAASLAMRLKLSTAEVVMAALLELDRRTPAADGGALTPEQKSDHDAFMSLVRDFQTFKRSDATSDHGGLYDEHGLPR